MFGSQILEVAIGLIFFYVLFSVISSAVKELISGFFSLRAKNLELAVRNLLQDPEGTGLAIKVFDHPLIPRLVKPDTVVRAPSYIDSRAFALALLDTIAPVTTEDGGQPRSLATIRDAVLKIDNPNLKKALLPLLDQAGQNVDQAVFNIELWFDSSMDRASGWYKRQSQKIILVIAFVFTVFMNVDTIAICNALWQEQALRDSVVAMATEQARQSSALSSTQATSSLNQLLAQKLQLPLGWSHEGGLAPQGWFIKILGLLLTTVAVSLGAPFWFDLLNKLVNLRAAGGSPPRAAGGSPPRTAAPPPQA